MVLGWNEFCTRRRHRGHRRRDTGPWPVLILLGITAGLVGCEPEPSPREPLADAGWPHYGADARGIRYSELEQVDRTNVRDLQVAWKTDLDDFDPDETQGREYRFEATPLVRDGTMYVPTPRGRLIALEPGSGEVLWEFDASPDPTRNYPEGWTTRGVAGWGDAVASPRPLCSHRIFMATVDGRLFAVDAEQGLACLDFGAQGVVTLDDTRLLGRPSSARGMISVTSPAVVVGDVLVVGSTMDKSEGGAPSGKVRALDVRTGALRWTFDPLPREQAHPAASHWPDGGIAQVAGGNVWSIMSADPERDRIFLPTASPAPEHYGGLRPGTNAFANSVVSLEASTGAFQWAWQVVHHDLWDYDVAASPLLVDLDRQGASIPAVVVGTKTGMLFVLDRRTGEPIFPVEEVPVPRSDVPGEASWPTQRVARTPPPLIGDRLTADSMFGITEEDRQACREQIRPLRNEGRFTPPSTRGTLMWPGVWGGINWSGLSWHPERQIVVTVLTRLAMVVQLHDRSAGPLPALRPGEQVIPQAGSDFVATRRPLVSGSGVPCSPPPWSLLVAVEIRADGAEVKWSRPLGRLPGSEATEDAADWGSLAFGGALITAGDLVFVAASQDDRIRAFDIETGDLLWEHELPAGGQATPMSYRYEGRQYVTIAAGGRSGIGTPGDWIVSFALPSEGAR